MNYRAGLPVSWVALRRLRRNRDLWNRVLTRRVSKKHNHSTVDRRSVCIRRAALLTESVSLSVARIKSKAKVRARETRSQHWYPESRVQILRKKCRTQSLWNLHLAGREHETGGSDKPGLIGSPHTRKSLAGDWHHNSETMPLGPKPHMMRCMLIR